MVTRAFLAVVLVVALAAAALAAGAPSRSTPAPPSRQPTSFELGVKAINAADWTRALSLFEKVVQAEPRNADAWDYIGFSHRKLGQFDKALTAYRKALAIDADHRGANEYLGELYLDTGDLAKAQGQLEKLGRLCPSGCKEYDDLKRAVEAYQARGKKS